MTLTKIKILMMMVFQSTVPSNNDPETLILTSGVLFEDNGILERWGRQ